MAGCFNPIFQDFPPTVSAHAGASSSRPEDIAGSLRLLAWLAAATLLIFADSRGDWLAQLRSHGSLLVQPLRQLAGMPAQLGKTMRSDAALRAQLARDNRVLRNALLMSAARVAKLETVAAENARLRAMLGVVEQGELDVQLAPVLDIDLDPTRQRLILDAGSRQGVRLGQTVMDAGGLLGQVIEVQPGTATVLLLTDPDHAVPVEIARNGVRLVAYGQGDHIALGNIPRSADIEVGDVVQTSGLGGRFPPGFKVGTVSKLRPDDSRAFMMADLQPAAALDRGREVLLLRQMPVQKVQPSTADALPQQSPAERSGETP
ncbi:rod shape-determining protein MreC [Lysobacteraceae bacterium NML03-0222]|nr:rod shape-determining protein MreC [Xanthomonadaceae bacterium NML03-0222]PJK08799.1 rod shape-determining protein MreC [Xanthomonadaceae bacterium NML95-0200]